MEKIIIHNDIRNACTFILDIRDNVKYRIDNKELYIIKNSYGNYHRYTILSYDTIVAYIGIDYDKNENIKHIRYNYTTYKYSRTTTKHIHYVYKILKCLSILNDCKVNCYALDKDVDMD